MFKKIVFVTLLLLGSMAWSFRPAFAAGCNQIVFSELEYDQVGTDNAEFVEFFLPAGQSASNCQLIRINGNTATAPVAYGTNNTFGFGGPASTYYAIGIGGSEAFGGCAGTDCLQNGVRDGFMVVDLDSNTVVMHFSYEGVYDPFDPDGAGPIVGTAPVDLGFSEGNTAPNQSIVNGSTGVLQNSTNVTPGAPNLDSGNNPTAVTLSQTGAQTAALPTLPFALAFLMLALASLAIGRRQQA